MPVQLDTAKTTLVLTETYSQITPTQLFDCWVTPSLLQQWWPTQAEVKPGVGGTYHFYWPKIDHHLRGTYRVFERGVQLAFTWKWDDDPPEADAREVHVQFEVQGDGACLTLTHGPYADTVEDQVLRIDHHLAGWRYFLPRLQAIRPD